MISILIPVFNKVISELVSTLSNQLTLSGIRGEIIIIDDGSDVYFRNLNHTVASLPLVTYLELQKNVGRNRIRQLLAETAKLDWLLYLDSDSKIISQNFISLYHQAILNTADVLIGGRRYVDSLPSECRFRLHWKYGTNREAAYYKGHHQIPYAGFMSNNFMIRREIFNQLTFIEELKDYGHEDTWIGIQLERLHAKMLFLNNPVLHDGLEDAEDFLAKTRSAVNNLNLLSTIVPADVLKKHVKLFRYHLLIRKLGLAHLFSAAYSMVQAYILKNIHSCNPSLFLFDLYRFNMLNTLKRQRANP